MFHGGITKKPGSAGQSNDSSRTRLYGAFRFAQFLILEILSVLVGGILVPSFLWSHATTVTTGSLRSFTLGQIAFKYTLQDVEFAILGVLLGTAVAWVLYAPSRFAGKPRVAHTLQQIHRKRFFWSQEHWRGGIGKAV